jgi:hypothetical protein
VPESLGLTLLRSTTKALRTLQVPLGKLTNRRDTYKTAPYAILVSLWAVGDALSG